MNHPNPYLTQTFAAWTGAPCSHHLSRLAVERTWAEKDGAPDIKLTKTQEIKRPYGESKFFAEGGSHLKGVAAEVETSDMKTECRCDEQTVSVRGTPARWKATTTIFVLATQGAWRISTETICSFQAAILQAFSDPFGGWARRGTRGIAVIEELALLVVRSK